MITYVNTSNKGSLNLRAEPSKTAKVLAQIPYGTKLETDLTTTEWCKVNYQQYTGYVMSQFLGSTDKQFTKADLQKIYDSLKSTLQTIENILK